MSWLFELYRTNPTAQAIAVIAVVCMLGLAAGSIKVRGIGLGTAAVLFVGIVVGYFSKPIDHHTLEFVKELGLLLFVFCIGLQLGPGFFYTDIEVVTGPLGQPRVLLHGGAADTLRGLLPEGAEAHIHLSLSDEDPYATAYALIEAREAR